MTETCNTSSETCPQQGTLPSTGCEMTDRILALADEAWHCLLKDKMKAAIEKSCGDKLDKLAAFATNANNERWSHMITGKAKCEQFKKELAEMMIAGATPPGAPGKK